VELCRTLGAEVCFGENQGKHCGREHLKFLQMFEIKEKGGDMVHFEKRGNVFGCKR
jgi:hypothetical protein